MPGSSENVAAGLKGTVRKNIESAHRAFDLLGVRRRDPVTRSVLTFGARAMLVKEHMEDREAIISALVEESKVLRARLGDAAREVPLVKVPKWTARRMR